MDYLKSQFDRIQQQLNALTASQKMLTAALVAIMVMTLVWWGRYAGRPEMEPLLTQGLSEEEVGRITMQLDAHGITHEVTADRKVLVPAERKIEIISVLAWADLMPQNTANGFDQIIQQLTPWDGNDRQNAMFNRGKEITLAAVIRKFPDVADATVAIDPKSERRIGGGGNIEPTAFVNIRMKAGAKPGKQLVKAAASAVAGAQAGLALKNVRVVVDGAPQAVRDAAEDGPAAEDLYDRRRQEEEWLTRKVAGQLADIPGVMVAVTVSINAKDSFERKKTVNRVSKEESHTESESTESQGTAAPTMESAAGSNVGATLVSAAAPQSTQSQSREKVDFAFFPDETYSETRLRPGEATPVGASVRVPRSHFVRIAKAGLPRGGPEEPDEKAIEGRMKDELPRIQTSVVRCLGLKDPEAVTVDPYFDQMPIIPEAPQAAAASFTFAVGGHAKEIALGALALVSLFFVSTIVKKGSPTPAVARAPELKAPPVMFDSGEPLVGEAGDGNPLLDGMELDDDQIKTQQMLQQVSTMVNENPDAAASLVKRWLNRS